jgi:glutamate dehydrogenase
MQRLEAEADLDRELESLPGAEQLAERRRAGLGMSRPELCVLLAFAKRSLEEDVRRSRSSLPDDPYLDLDLRRYFPAAIVERFGHLIAAHPLRRDLASTIVANDVVNSLGITWISRLSTETGAEPAELARAYWTARDVSGAIARWEAVEALDGKLDPVVQNVLMVGVDTLVEDLSRWYLLNAPDAPIGETVASAAPRFSELSEVIDCCGSEAWRQARETIASGLVEQGVAPELARRHAFQPELAHGPDIIAVSDESGRSIEDVANLFFLAGERLHLDWLEQLLGTLPERSRFERWAVLALEDDLLGLRRNVARRVLAEVGTSSVEAAFDDYLAARAHGLDRLRHLVGTLDAEDETTVAALTVAVRQVRSLVG